MRRPCPSCVLRQCNAPLWPICCLGHAVFTCLGAGSCSLTKASGPCHLNHSEPQLRCSHPQPLCWSPSLHSPLSCTCSLSKDQVDCSEARPRQVLTILPPALRRKVTTPLLGSKALTGWPPLMSGHTSPMLQPCCNQNTSRTDFSSLKSIPTPEGILPALFPLHGTPFTHPPHPLLGPTPPSRLT